MIRVAEIVAGMVIAFVVGWGIGGGDREAPCFEDQAYIIARDPDGLPDDDLDWQCIAVDDLID